VTDSHIWLDARLADAPDRLRASVLREVDVQRAAHRAPRTADPRDFAAVLKAAAERLLAAPTAPDGAALSLLTADALITLACEWVADQDLQSSWEPW
jgi:hypothetical protein